MPDFKIPVLVFIKKINNRLYGNTFTPFKNKTFEIPEDNEFSAYLWNKITSTAICENDIYYALCHGFNYDHLIEWQYSSFYQEETNTEQYSDIKIIEV